MRQRTRLWAIVRVLVPGGRRVFTITYNLYRYYDPTVGRYLSKDPIGLAGGINVYQYAPNPTGWVDPLGLSGFEPKVITSGTVFRNASGTPR
ncbi:RHS repeat-associated core domain-containing protein [Burkholderia sp. Bp9012]|nr:RHS repeat-associated core domain-containing protein [Burkholderia sp. Bp9012]RQR80252.1 RHS repeat-associated core domain-containing protein [Burkholderia sp. Bp9012]